MSKVTDHEAAAVDPQKSDEITVAVPAFNEAATIGSVILAAQEVGDRVVVYDDGSFDGTAALARSAGAEVLEAPENSGKGAAVRELFEFARSNGLKRLVMLDADWQHDPAEIPDLVAPLEQGEADIVVGSRYLDGDYGNTPAYRRVGQKTLDAMTNLGNDVAVTDSQSGFRAFNRHAIETLDISDDGFGVETEMLRTAADEGLRITEVPIDVNYDVPNPNTSNSLIHGFSVVDSVLRVVRDRHPLLFFGVPGAIMTAAGLFYGAWTVSLYQTGGNFYMGKALFSTVMFLVGIFSVYSALIMNMLGNKLEQI
jgi:glycosyltransferase involved in cell wall biosynthesis